MNFLGQVPQSIFLNKKERYEKKIISSHLEYKLIRFTRSVRCRNRSAIWHLEINYSSTTNWRDATISEIFFWGKPIFILSDRWKKSYGILPEIIFYIFHPGYDFNNSTINITSYPYSKNRSFFYLYEISRGLYKPHTPKTLNFIGVTKNCFYSIFETHN